jgi:Transcriptional regulator SbtR-like, C-terminal domain
VDHGLDALHGEQVRAGADDPGAALFGFLARIAEEAAAKRDLPDAIAIAGSLQDALHAALDVLLCRAQQAGAVRADIRTPDLIVLLKEAFASIQDASAGAVDPAVRDRVFAVVADGFAATPLTTPGAGSQALLTPKQAHAEHVVVPQPPVATLAGVTSRARTRSASSVRRC